MYQIRLVFMLLIPIMLLQACAAVVVGGAATTAAVAYDRRTAGAVLDDQTIEAKAKYAIFQDKDIHSQSNINVTSYNGFLLLSGETPTEALKQKAENLVKDIPKVRKVFNELAISGPSALTSRSSDSWITTKVKTKMTQDENVDPFFVKVVTERGVVYLMGKVTREEADQAVAVTRTTKGVLRVVKIFEYID
ncbi:MULTISPECIES: BON domain-containing protein [unclassified Methylophaga]|uniref:BON domain-containing protein n=1 Tax=unclassified Methylophaga TaxID=2629249 RepID=UPI000C98F2E6|nr:MULTISPECIES: BON domain-containing protein [unclassified Methylophaga]MAK66935.1 BON domain-containing protein [Methylophaga sp.]MAY17971.1 BON domain-containing protein [Methylophaga sp.]MBN47181.1 BON domain-containing protein [Methylophaga sp.]HAO24084.1 BON domain-containing protein [Methylophaga sp.]HCD05885.1 BON domain-containing protein [Methylophaga sp.]